MMDCKKITYDELNINNIYKYKSHKLSHVNLMMSKHKNTAIVELNFLNNALLMEEIFYEKFKNYKKCVHPYEPYNYLTHIYFNLKKIQPNIKIIKPIKNIINNYCDALICGNYNSCIKIIYINIDLLQDLDNTIQLCEDFAQYLENLPVCGFQKGFEKIVTLNDISNLYKYIISLKNKTYNIENSSDWLINYY